MPLTTTISFNQFVYDVKHKKKTKHGSCLWSFTTYTSIQTSRKNWYLIFTLFVQIIQGCIWKFPDSDLLGDSITDYSHIKEMIDCSMAIIRDEIVNSLAFSNVFFVIGCLINLLELTFDKPWSAWTTKK